MTTRIYTIGCEHRSPNGLLKLLRSQRIDCVVDIRTAPNDAEKKLLAGGKLKSFLQKHSIYYLPFTYEFTDYSQDCYDTTDTIIYNKVIQASKFIGGVERLLTGMSKGYTIAIMGSSKDPLACFRYAVLGRYLSEKGALILHIMKDGTLLNQMVLQQEEEKQLSSAKRVANKSMARRKGLGKWGEDLAAEYLKENGYTIQERNWHYNHREIDIIAIHPVKKIISFVEVKTRRNNNYGNPEIAVNRQKMWFMLAAANHYVRTHALPYDIQFDIIAITGTPETSHTLKYIPDAIPPSVRTIYRR